MTTDFRSLKEQPHIAEGTQQRIPETATMTPAEHAEWRRQQHQRRQRERDERAARELKSAYRRRYMASPGATAEGFEATWPSLLEEHHRAVARGENPLQQGEPVNPHADPAKWGL